MDNVRNCESPSNLVFGGTGDYEGSSSSTSSSSTQTEDKQQPPGVRQKLKTLTFGRRRKNGVAAPTSKEPLPDPANPKPRKGSWGFKLGCKTRRSSASDPVAADPPTGCGSCICTGYRRTEEHLLGPKVVFKASAARGSKKCSSSTSRTSAEASKFSGAAEEYQVDDWDERARKERAREIEEGVDPPPGFRADGGPRPVPSKANEAELMEWPCPPAPQQPQQPQPQQQQQQQQLLQQQPQQLPELALALRNQLSLSNQHHPGGAAESLSLPWEVLRRIWDMGPPQVHTQVDYMHCLVPDLLGITACGFYWGKMDRYEAERLLENKPEGTFLLRDSAQEEYLFSVSFRRYGRSLHARVEQWNHRFSFDSHDPGVFSSRTVCGLVEHYKDPSCCMYFEPMLTRPLHRTFAFSLQHLARAVICSRISYDGASRLPLPRCLRAYLREYHYKQRVRVRQIEDGGATTLDVGFGLGSSSGGGGRGYGLLGQSSLGNCRSNPEVNLGHP